MLSRVAERVYWMGRYIERVENLSRLINVNSNLLLDLPQGSRVSWLTLVDITGTNEEFTSREVKNEEQTIMRFLIADASCSGSILSCLRFARENARTTREVIPSEVWELINDSYLFAKEYASSSLSRAARSRFLRTIIERMQLCSGMLDGTMSHTSAYDFIRMGALIERADMTTRIVEVGAINFSSLHKQAKQDEEYVDPAANILWMSVLQSLSAYQMYRQHMQLRVSAEDVLQFLIKGEQFPRAVSCCLLYLRAYLVDLPNHDEALRTLASVQRQVDAVDVNTLLSGNELPDFIDALQQEIASIHTQVLQTWFLPDMATA